MHAAISRARSPYDTVGAKALIQCVPIKRKPVFQYDIFISTQDLIKLYTLLSRAFSLLSFDTKHMMISQCMTEQEQFKLMHVKIDLHRIMVLS